MSSPGAPPPSNSLPIIDSHIHLYPSSELTTLSWMTPSHPLASQRSITEYKTAIAPSPSHVEGFIAIEAARLNASSTDWTHPLQELSFLSRIAAGLPNPDEGHEPQDASLLLGIVPWAPLNLGVEQLEKYLAQAEEEAGPETWKKVKGFRYLLQDQPNGTGLEEGFVEGLKLLGRRGFVFDVGVDQHRRGKVQLEELVDMMERAHEGVEREEEKIVFILSEFGFVSYCS